MIGALTNHLWQSTLVVLAAGLVAAALRKNSAHVRHRIWLIASLKFLVPFSILMSLGGALLQFTPVATTSATLSAPDVSSTVDRIAEPFTSNAFFPATPAPTTPRTNWTAILAGAWAMGLIGIVVMRGRGWRRIRAAVLASVPVPIETPVPVRSSAGLLEPGVVGLFRPVLLVPAGIELQLTPRQLEAVLAHELCHVTRRDNLTSAIHMVVEAVFWFHPLVWFVGARLVDERERACDEHVLRVCGEPQAYAESILSVVKLYVESPLACVSGVTGSDLKKRVAAILVNRVGLQLSLVRKVTLAIAAVLAIALPLGAGMLIASLGAQSAPVNGAGTHPTFDVVSVKPCDRDAPGQSRGGGGTPITSTGRLYLQCLTLDSLFLEAYISFADGRGHGLAATLDVGVEGEPDWMKSERYAIEAKTEQAAPDAVMRGPMLQAVLEDRFRLKVRHVTREMPVYELVVAQSGAKVSPYTGHDCVIRDEAVWPPLALPAGQRYCGDRSRGDGDRFIREGVTTLDQLASFFVFDRPVVDRTGITAPVSYRLEYVKEDQPVREAPRAPWLSALRNQLGLDLRASKGPRDFLVIDHVERPTPNPPSPIAPDSRGFGAASQAPTGVRGAGR